jgi:hypothetical protein
VRGVVEDGGFVGFIQFENGRCLLVEDVAWVERKHRRVRLGLRWQPFEIVPFGSAGGVFGEGFELVALEWL